jgi:hypothetical protein
METVEWNAFIRPNRGTLGPWQELNLRFISRYAITSYQYFSMQVILVKCGNMHTYLE